jgi:hypothetical protein
VPTVRVLIVTRLAHNALVLELVVHDDVEHVLEQLQLLVDVPEVAQEALLVLGPLPRDVRDVPLRHLVLLDALLELA